MALDDVLKLIVGFILLITAVIFLIPTTDVLTFSITLPAIDSNVRVLQNKVTIFQSFVGSDNIVYGDIEVKVILQDSLTNVKFNETYFLNRNSWVINTFEPVSKGDIVIIQVPSSNLDKAITIE